MRTVIISSNGYHDKRLLRVLSNNNINGDIVSKLTRKMINEYDCVIFSHKNDIPNLPKVMEQIVLERSILVLYVNNVSSIANFYNLIGDVYFNQINEIVLDVELPIVLKTSIKYIKKINMLERDYKLVNSKYTDLKSMNLAKRLLMSKGLSEAESHQFIQHKSMDLRISKKNLVNLIIENKIDF